MDCEAYNGANEFHFVFGSFFFFSLIATYCPGSERGRLVFNQSWVIIVRMDHAARFPAPRHTSGPSFAKRCEGVILWLKGHANNMSLGGEVVIRVILHLFATKMFKRAYRF